MNTVYVSLQCTLGIGTKTNIGLSKNLPCLPILFQPGVVGVKMPLLIHFISAILLALILISFYRVCQVGFRICKEGFTEFSKTLKFIVQILTVCCKLTIIFNLFKVWWPKLKKQIFLSALITFERNLWHLFDASSCDI